MKNFYPEKEPTPRRSKLLLLTVLVAAAFLIVLFALPAAAKDGVSTDMVTAGKVYAYQGPGEQYPLLAIYTQGITITVTGRTPDKSWLQVAITDYNTAWMPADSFVEGSSLEALPLAATPAGLATVIPTLTPPLTVRMELVQNNSEGFPWPGQRFKIYVHSRQPFTRINIIFYNEAGMQVMKYSGATDAQGYFTNSYMSGVLTDGAYTVVVTDMSGNTAQASATIHSLQKPTPTPKD